MSCVMSVCPTVHLHGITRLPLNEFFYQTLYSIIFRKSIENVEDYLNLTKITCTLHVDHTTFLILSCSFRLRMTNDADRILVKLQSTFPVQYLKKKSTFYEIMWENIVELSRPQMTLWRCMRIACWITEAKNTPTHNI